MVTAEVRHHLERVLRGTDIAVDYTDGAGDVGSGTYRDGAVTRGTEGTAPPPTPRVVLAVAAPQSSDRQRQVVEKLAELGVDELIWLRTQHGGHRPPPQRRSDAWAVAALEQSRGTSLLAIGPSTDLAQLAASGTVHIAHAGCPSLMWDSGDQITIAVGPEGGFGDEEVRLPGVTCFGLGERILRVETAAVVSASLALHMAGRLQGRPAGNAG